MKVNASLSGQTRPVRAQRRTTRLLALALLTLAVALASPARAELSKEELAKLSQNPVANLISVPVQNNTNFNYGPQDGTQNILNIEPVIPVTLNSDWNVITRTILPLIWQPPVVQGQSNVFGLGDMQFSAFLSPANASGWIWGAGVIAQLPTHSDSELGNNNWGLGPTAVVLRLQKDDPWVYGMLINNVWSLGTSSGAPAYNNLLFEPFVNYNLPGGTYINSVPIITANWEASSGNQWTVPLGAGVGHIFHLGRLPVNAQLGAYYNIVRPDNGPTWQLRAQVQFMFPK